MSYKATIFIPTFNGERYLNTVLQMIFRQKVDFRYEVLIIDSGSTDNSLSIIRKYQKKHNNLRLQEIPNSEFGHGKTRNLAAQIAEGEYIVYLTQDAIPANNKWLSEMLKPFSINNKIVAVMGKQTPRPKCFPLMKYDIQRVFTQCGPDTGVTLFYKGKAKLSKSDLNFISFYTDVNSATIRRFLLKEISYRDVPYAEDQAFGKDIIDSGYIKAYAPLGNVWHSNDILLRQYNMRIFDEIIGLRKTGHIVEKRTILQSLPPLIKEMVLDSWRIMKDNYSWKRKLYWLAINPFYHIQRFRGMYKGSRIKLNDTELINNNSLELSSKK